MRAFLGRLCFSLIFIIAGITHFKASTVALAATAGVPAYMVYFAGLLALAGGLLVLSGRYARAGAWLIVFFLVPVTLKMHRFWGITDPRVAQMQQIHFMKNLAMLGGALLITLFGAQTPKEESQPEPGRAGAWPRSREPAEV